MFTLNMLELIAIVNTMGRTLCLLQVLLLDYLKFHGFYRIIPLTFQWRSVAQQLVNNEQPFIQRQWLLAEAWSTANSIFVSQG
jgi:hypothetical protein